MIEKLRNFMNENCIDYFLINTADEYLLEYNDIKTCFRYIMTGFTGSMGEALLTKDKLFLFVDGRYHTQADLEVDSSVINIVKLGMGENYLDKISEIIQKGSKFALISKTVSLKAFENLEKKLKDKEINFLKLQENPVFKPEKNIKKASVYTFDIGYSVQEKIEKLNLKENEVFLVSALDEIAYLTNLRSFNIPFSSSFYSKMIVEKNKINLFCDGEISSCAKEIEVFALNEFENYLKNNNKKVLYTSKNINLYNFDLIKENCKELTPSPIEVMKSVKTYDELEYIKECYRKTDIVVNRVKELIERAPMVTERSIAGFLGNEFFKVGARYQSFTPIVAFGKNSAIIHYKDYDEKEYLKDGDFVLLDCGAYFDGGFATDITRTFYKGEISDEQKMIYEAVKKAHLTVLNATFDELPTAFELDKIARDMLKEYEKYGYKFSHSLGHGVGINVHEHPPVLAPVESAKVQLKENMVFTIEPGLYKEGVGGVRLENSVYLTKINGKYCFKSLSFVDM